MSRVFIRLAVFFALTGTIVGSIRAEITPEQVRQAINRGTAYLKSQLRADGSWPEMVAMPGGVSALCTLALLNAGVDAQDEHIQRALNYLRSLKPERTYVVALQTMVFARAEPDKDRLLISRNVKWLEGTQIVEGEYKGAWSYPGLGGAGDNSNSQFALLALHEAERLGISASERTWRLAKAYWEGCQNADGSWGYNRQSQGGTGSMTCAGITSLIITADKVRPGSARVHGERIHCCTGGEADEGDRIERALQWLGAHYSVARNPGAGNSWLLYYLYGLERVGRMTARRFLPLPGRGRTEGADWYREGAENLVRLQDSISGFWTSAGPAESDPHIGTSLALLFLSKGRWPTLLAKARHGAGEDWDRHRNDVANLTRYVETRWKRDLTWQVIDVRLATVEDLLQTPVLYLCGSSSPLSEDPAQRKELAEKLRAYLERGGFLLAEGYCGEQGFDAGFRELLQLMFPEPEYKLRLLEPDHPIWYAEEVVPADQLRPLWGVDFGCRTSVVYAPVDPPHAPRPALSCLWELSRPGRGEKYPPTVQAQIDAALSLGINILAYATNRELQSKEDFFRPAVVSGQKETIERGRLSLATLRHPGGCNAAPRAVPNLMEFAQAELKLRTYYHPEPVDLLDEALFDYHLLFMQGRSAFRFSEAERRQLKQYLERGGMLLADAICASQAFVESFRREMAAIVPEQKLQRIPADDPLLSTTYGGLDLQLVSLREPENGSPGKPLRTAVRKIPPYLEGIKLGDRWAVILSPYDLSCALEKHDSPGCRGYTREDAAKLGLNVILYSLQQ